jgi:hypothetical protein
MHEDGRFDTAAALLQVGIVLASAGIITGTAALAWVAGALGLGGAVLRVTWRWANPPTLRAKSRSGSQPCSTASPPRVWADLAFMPDTPPAIVARGRSTIASTRCCHRTGNHPHAAANECAHKGIAAGDGSHASARSGAAQAASPSAPRRTTVMARTQGRIWTSRRWSEPFEWPRPRFARWTDGNLDRGWDHRVALS